MPQWITQLDALQSLGPMGLILVYVILDKMGLISNKRGNIAIDEKHTENQEAIKNLLSELKDIKKLVYEAKDKTDDLYKWHDVRDADGVPKWYIKESMEETMKVLAEAIKEQSENTKDLSTNIKLEGQVLTQLVAEVKELSTNILK
jgi:hypothetical protein